MPRGLPLLARRVARLRTGRRALLRRGARSRLSRPGLPLVVAWLTRTGLSLGKARLRTGWLRHSRPTRTRAGLRLGMGRLRRARLRTGCRTLLHLGVAWVCLGVAWVCLGMAWLSLGVALLRLRMALLGVAWLPSSRLALDLARLRAGWLCHSRLGRLSLSWALLGMVAWLGAGARLGWEASGLGVGRLAAWWWDGCYLHRWGLGRWLVRFAVGASAAGLVRVQDFRGGEPACALLRGFRHGYAAQLAVSVDYLARAAGAGTRERHHLTP